MVFSSRFAGKFGKLRILMMLTFGDFICMILIFHFIFFSTGRQLYFSISTLCISLKEEIMVMPGWNRLSSGINYIQSCCLSHPELVFLKKFLKERSVYSG